MIIDFYKDFITPALVKKKTNIEDEVDDSVILPNIETAFEIYIYTTYEDNEGFWEDIQTKYGNDGSGLDPVYAELIERLQKPICAFVEAISIKPNTLKQTAAGTTKRQPIDTVAPSFKETSDYTADKTTQANQLWDIQRRWIDKTFIPHQKEKTTGNANDCEDIETESQVIGGFYVGPANKSNNRKY